MIQRAVDKLLWLLKLCSTIPARKYSKKQTISRLALHGVRRRRASPLVAQGINQSRVHCIALSIYTIMTVESVEHPSSTDFMRVFFATLR